MVEHFHASDQPLPLFQGSTHSLFCVNIVDTSSQHDDVDSQTQQHPRKSTDHLPYSSFFLVQGYIVEGASSAVLGAESECALTVSHKSFDSTSRLSDAENVRLLHKYQSTVGFMYPIVRFQAVTKSLEELTMSRARCLGTALSGDAIDDMDRAIITTMVAIASESEEKDGQKSTFVQPSGLRERANEMLWSCKVDLKGLVFLTLMVSSLERTIQVLPRSQLTISSEPLRSVRE